MKFIYAICILSVFSMKDSSHRRRRAITVDVIVTLQEADIVKSDAFTYDESLTPTVSSVDPVESSVLGK